MIFTKSFNIKNWQLAFTIWLMMFLLNYFCYPFPGDDYVYSFIWEGHAIGVPLSEGAMRIQSFPDSNFAGKNPLHPLKVQAL